MARTPKPVVLGPIHPNAGLEAAYRRKLLAAIEEMQRSLDYWLSAQWRARPPEMAGDESPAAAMLPVFKRLTRRWEREFERLAQRLSPEFMKKARRHTDQAFAERLRTAGFTVRFRESRVMNDVYQAAQAENVALIKSIATQHLEGVEGLVMRSVQHGRDLHELSTELQARYGVTKKRAALIARDQNNKATAALTRARQTELGITKARWVHSTGGKTPRPSHVKMGGQLYDVAEGMWDPDLGKRIFPGELISCRCVSRSVIEGFS